jgi:hypothetical protein
MNPDFTTGDIYPGIGIGDFHLGMPLSQLCSCLTEDILISEVVRDGTVIIRTPPLVFRANLQTEKVEQITVHGSFSGKIFGTVGLGNTIALVREYLGPIRPHRHERLYFLECHEGIAFEIAEIPRGDERTLGWTREQHRLQDNARGDRGEHVFLQNGALEEREVEAIHRARESLHLTSPLCCDRPGSGCEAANLVRLDALLNTAPIQAIHVYPRNRHQTFNALTVDCGEDNVCPPSSVH